MPVPIVRNAMSRQPCPAPQRCSARAVALASFSSCVGRPNSASSKRSERHGFPGRQVRRGVDRPGRRVQRAAAGDAQRRPCRTRRRPDSRQTSRARCTSRATPSCQDRLRGRGGDPRQHIAVGVADHGRRFRAADVQPEQQSRGQLRLRVLRCAAGHDPAIGVSVCSSNASPLIPCCFSALGMPLPAGASLLAPAWWLRRVASFSLPSPPSAKRCLRGHGLAAGRLLKGIRLGQADMFFNLVCHMVVRHSVSFRPVVPISRAPRAWRERFHGRSAGRYSISFSQRQFIVDGVDRRRLAGWVAPARAHLGRADECPRHGTADQNSGTSHRPARRCAGCASA